MKKITDEELIQQLKDRLDEHKQTIDELRSVSDELRSVNRRLEESESLKSHFISNMTNEMMNPFASIMALSREILALKVKQDWNKVEMMVNLIHTETFYLDFQLRNIFAAARIEAGDSTIEISKVDVNSLLTSVIDLFELEAIKHKITIKTNISNNNETLFFNSDHSKIKLILINLISNALKFSFENSTVETEINILENTLEIIVKDYGRGIPDEFHSEIYDRFKRNDETINSVVRGNGLGLSINKAFVDFLNGTIDFESEVGKGTTFRVLIPESDKDIIAYTDGGNEFFFEDDDEFVL